MRRDGRLLTVSQAAALLGISSATAYRMARSGVLPGLARLPGFRLIVRRSARRRWKDAQDPAAEAPLPAPLRVAR